MDNASFPEVRVPAHMQVLTVRCDTSSMEIDVNAHAVIPVGEETDRLCVLRDSVGDAAADI